MKKQHLYIGLGLAVIAVAGIALYKHKKKGSKKEVASKDATPATTKSATTPAKTSAVDGEEEQSNYIKDWQGECYCPKTQTWGKECCTSAK